MRAKTSQPVFDTGQSDAFADESHTLPVVSDRCGIGSWGSWDRQRPSLGGYVTDALSSIHNHLRLLKKLAPRRHWVSGEAVTRVRLIAGCGRLDCFLASSLLRSSSAFASVARGR